MKNMKFGLGISVLALVFGTTILGCFTTPKIPKVSLGDDNALKEYLDNQPANTPDNPIEIIMPLNDSTLRDVAAVLRSTDKYINLSFDGTGLTTIGDSAFKDCKSLIKITLPNSVISIGDSAFNGCANLTDINFGSKVASISYNAFNNCLKLISINADYSNQNYASGLYSQENGVYSRPLYNKNKTILIRCPEGYKGNFNIADSVKSLAPYCFYQTTINNMTISQDVGSYAFSGSSIASVTLNGGGLDLSAQAYRMQKIYQNAFVNCNKLTSVEIYGSTELDKGSFDGNLFDVWDKATTHKDGFREVGNFKGTYTRSNGTSAVWTKK